MKTHGSLAFATAALIGLTNSFGQADATFTKITTGPHVNDTGRAWGAAWGDFDNDGFIDLVVANEGADFLYRNNGDGTFSTNITSSPITTDESDGGAGVCWGDYDNDGHLDLIVGGYGAGIKTKLFRNNGDGTFVKIQGKGPDAYGDASSVNWGDYNNDGYLDVMITRWGPANLLYRNDDDGSFLELPSYVGDIVTTPGNSNAGIWGDYDDDGDLDMFVTRGNAKNSLYRNDGEYKFTTLSQENTGDLDDPLTSRSNGAAWGDYDNDGDLDIFIAQGGSAATVSDVLYRHNSDGTFTRMTSDVVGELVNDLQPGAGCAWADYDNDGWLDLYVANPGLTFSGGESGRANLLYRNNGDGSFTQVTTGRLVEDVASSNTGIWGDYDNDGFMDLFVANGAFAGGQADCLYRNDGNTNSWLKLNLVGTTSNRSAIGAKVRVKATINGTNFWQLREISGGDGYFSQNDIRPNFGLGDATNAETVRIEWPSGVVQELHNVSAKQVLTVTEPPPLKGTNSQVVFIRDYLRDANGNSPVGDATPVYLKGVEGIWLCDQAEPVLSPEGRHLTLGDLNTARGTLTAECVAQGTRVTLQLSGLVSNALYTVWLLTFTAPGYEASYTNLIGVGALGAPDGSQNVVRASATGEAQLTVIHPAGDLSEFGLVGRCLFDEFEFQTSVAYHTDGMTHGPSAGPPCTYFEQFGINLRSASEPTLAIQRAVLLSWQVTEGSFVLEGASAPEGSWITLQVPVTLANGVAQATVVAEAGNQFFRLRRTE